MTAIAEKITFAKGLTVAYDNTVYPNNTSLQPQEERATITRMKADLLLPDNKIMKIDMNFDAHSGYHENAVIVMDDDGAQLIADAFTHRYGKEAGDEIMEKWQNRDNANDPRKPTFLFVKKPESESEKPFVFASCGSKAHDPVKPY